MKARFYVKPSVTYSDELIREGCGISSCVPVYVNVVPEIDQTFFREEEPEELSLSTPLADQEIVDNSKIANCACVLWYIVLYRSISTGGIR